MCKKIGFEKEYFLVDQKGLVIDPAELGFPTDEFGVLVEARGRPSSNIDEAILSLELEEQKLARKAKSLGMELVCKGNMKLNKRQVSEAYSKYGKNPSESRNLYGKFKRFSLRNVSAGLHVHFSDTRKEEIPIETNYYFLPGNKKHIEKTTKAIVISNMLDLAKIIRTMDEKFKDIIKAARRTPGEYELKLHGFEYRSLPATAPLLEVAETAMEALEAS